MTYEQIEYVVSDHIATITLDREAKLNAFTVQMAHELVDAIDRADADDGVRAMVFTGRGRAFCAGADLSAGTEIFERGASDGFRMERDADSGGIVARRLFESLKPSIAAINGAAVGIGITMTLAMDIRLASPAAKMGFVFAKVGLVPEACSAWFLPRIVGISQAAEWVYSGRVFGADEALEAGLLRAVVPADDLLAEAYTLATSLFADTSAVSVAMSRRMLWHLLGERTPIAAHEIDSRAIDALGRAPDAEAGVQAFLSRSKPDFPMRVSTDLPEFFKTWQRLGGVDALIEAERQVASRPDERNGIS